MMRAQNMRAKIGLLIMSWMKELPTPANFVHRSRVNRPGRGLGRRQSGGFAPTFGVRRISEEPRYDNGQAP